MTQTTLTPGGPVDQDQLDQLDQVPDPTPPAQPAPAAPPADDQLQHAAAEEARQLYRDQLAAGTDLSAAELAERFGKSERWARGIRADVNGPATSSTSSPPAKRKTKTARPAKQRSTDKAAKPADAGASTAPAPVQPSTDHQAPAGEATPQNATQPAELVDQAPAEFGPEVDYDRSGYLLAWVGMTLGAVVSVGGNIRAVQIESTVPLDVWTLTGAAVWPVALLISVEVLSRTAWQAGAWWKVLRAVALAGVAIGGAVISYGHLHDVLVAQKYATEAAVMGPVVIDGLMLLCGFSLLSTTKLRRAARKVTR